MSIFIRPGICHSDDMLYSVRRLSGRVGLVVAALLAGTAALAATPVPSARADQYIAAVLAADPDGHRADLDGPPRAIVAGTSPLPGMRRFARGDELPVIDRLLGAQAEQNFDGPAAERHLVQALAGAVDEATRASLLMGLARVRAWRSTAEARDTLEELPPAFATHAAVHQQRARLALMDNDHGGALAALDAAAAAAPNDAVRLASLDADRAIVLAMAGATDAAVLKLAEAGFSGQNSRLMLPVYGPPPKCGDGGLRPDDRAIFALSVSGIAPDRISLVHASRQDPAAIAAFGHMLANWAWPEADAKVVAARGNLRIAISCSHVGNAPIPDLVDVMPDRTDWFLERGVSVPIVGDEYPRPADIDAGLAAAGTEAEPLAVLPWLMLQAAHPRLSARKRLVAATRARTVAEAAGAPPGILAVIALARVYTTPNSQWFDGLEAVAMSAGKDEETRLLGLYLWQDIALQSFGAGRTAEAKRLALRGTTTPDTADPRALWLRRNMLRVIYNSTPSTDSGRDAIAARADVPDDACGLRVVVPALEGLNTPKFPADSKAARLSGFVNVEVDVTSGLAPAAAHVVSSIPALLFDSAALSIFETPTLGQPAACRGYTQMIRFKASGRPMK
jgi:hypothetical protein